MTLAYAISYFLLGAMFFASIFGIFISVFMPGIDKLNRKFFALMFGNLTLLVIALGVDLVYWTINTMLTVDKIAIFFEYFFNALMMINFTIYLIRFCGESLRNKLFYAISVLFVIYLILLVVAQFTEIFYYITEKYFYRGEWHFILTLPLISMMFLNIFGVIRRKKFLSKRYFLAFLFYLLPMTVGAIIHVIEFSIFLWVFGIIFFYGSNGCDSFF